MSFKDIGRKIQMAREEKSMSQEQLARLLGCSQSALSNYEKGKRRLYLSQLERLAEILNKPLEFFVESLSNSHDPEPANHEKKVISLVNLIYRLGEEEIDDVMNYICYLEWKKSRRA